MTQSSPLSIRVEKPGKSLGEAMSEIRSWLDSHKIQPAEFKTLIGRPGTVAFDIRFAREDEARLFEKTFTRSRSALATAER